MEEELQNAEVTPTEEVNAEGAPVEPQAEESVGEEVLNEETLPETSENTDEAEPINEPAEADQETEQ